MFARQILWLVPGAIQLKFIRQFCELQRKCCLELRRSNLNAPNFLPDVAEASGKVKVIAGPIKRPIWCKCWYVSVNLYYSIHETLVKKLRDVYYKRWLTLKCGDIATHVRARDLHVIQHTTESKTYK